MKIILAVCLFLISTASAQSPTPDSIQKDFDDTFNYYYSAALKFVNDLGTELDARVNQYVKVHEEFINQLRNISNIPNIKIDPQAEKIIEEGISLLNLLIEGYRNSLKKDIFIEELDKYMDMLKTQYLSKAQKLIDQLKNEVVRNAALGQCWMDAQDGLGNIVKTGFLAARDAAITTVVNAKSTLDLTEFIVKSTIESNKLFITSCQAPGVDINFCISSFLNIVQITIPANVNTWASLTEGALKTNLQLAEILINSAALNAMNGIVPVVNTIERCVLNILANIII